MDRSHSKMAKRNPSTAKGKRPEVMPTVGREPAFGSQRPVWRFSYVDTKGPWCWTCLKDEELIGVLERLKAFETMPWGQILGDKHHLLCWESLSTKAQKRLQEIGRADEADNLCSLRISGQPRVIGILDRHIFYILWWDPKHEVCPSALR